MEHGASERVKEQSHTVMPVKAEVDKAAQCTAYHGVQTNANFTEEEPGLAELVKSEPALLVQDAVAEDGWQDIPELQCIQGPSTSAIVGSANVLDSVADLDNVLNVKEELGAIDIGPTVLQHTDAWCTTKQKEVSVVKEERAINHDKTDPILCSGVKEGIIEDKQRADTDDQRSNKASQSEQRARSQLYSCDKCVTTYASKKSLMAHYRNLHSTQSHKCTKCNEKFPSKPYLYNHTKRVHSEQQYECAVCRKIYGSKMALNQHVYYVHQPRPAVTSPVVYACDYCHKTYTTKKGLIYHINVVHTKVRYRCSECNKEYKGKLYLQRHMKKVHSKEEHEFSSPVVHTCDHCHKTYINKQGLIRHIDVVHTKVLYRCSECNVEFKGKHLLQGHMTRVHLKEKHERSRQLHTCNNCGSNFDSKLYYQRHEKRGKCTRPTAIYTSAAASTSRQQPKVVIVKEEPADGELDLGPVVFQHMDCNYRPYKPEPQLD